jgi:recombination protein RecA
MANVAIARDQLESLLRERKLDHTLTTAFGSEPAEMRWLVPTGIAELDARLDGGIPRGHLSEVIGPRSSGRLAILVSALAGATSRGEAVALVDPLDMFDPVSASASGLDFQRMLWVRGEASSAARVSLSCEYGTLQKSLDRAVKALNIILQAGGFGLVVLDLGEVSVQTIKRLPYTTWVRLHRIIEGSETACVVIGSEPISRSAGGVTVQLNGPKADSLKPKAGYIDARVVRSRAMESDQHVRVPLSAAAC